MVILYQAEEPVEPEEVEDSEEDQDNFQSWTSRMLACFSKKEAQALLS